MQAISTNQCAFRSPHVRIFEMQRDLRNDPLYRHIAEHFRRATEPGLGRMVDGTDLSGSADGRYAAVAGSVPAALEGVAPQRVALFDLASGEQRLLGDTNDDGVPRFAPVGTMLAFVSDRETRGQSGLYLCDAPAGEPQRHAREIPDPIEALAWSPSGARLLIQTVGAGADKAGAMGSGTLPGAAADLPAWLPEVEEAVPEAAWRKLWVYDLTTRAVHPIETSGVTVWESAWCGPDRILAVVSSDPRESAWYDAELVLIGRDGTRQTLYRSDFEIGLPAASPSGRYAAVVEASCSDRTVVAGDIVIFDLHGGVTRPVVGGDVVSIGFLDDERLYFTAIDDDVTFAGEVTIATGDVRRVWTSHGSALRRYPAVVPIGSGAYATVAHAYDRAPALVRIADGAERVVHDFAHEGTAYVREVAGELETVRWEGRDGLSITGYLARPSQPGPYPLVVMVHGGPTWCYSNTWQMYYRLAPLLVARGIAVLHPNPRGSSGRGQDFARIVRGDMNGEDTFDIIAGAQAMVDRGIADRLRLAVTGGSYGGMMSSWIITRTEMFAASIPVSPVTDNLSQHFTSNIGRFDELFLDSEPSELSGRYYTRSAVLYAKNVTTPTLNIAGGRDRCTPPGQALEFHRALVEAGVKSELVIYPNEGHGVREYEAYIDYCTRIVAWLDTCFAARSELHLAAH
jgi:dipeptidyl aminopeptidase/acylaminoacyl peptidase